MGKFGVDSLVRLLAGETIDPVIDTGTVLVDLSNAVDFDSNPDNDADND
jgi:ribose transport system substrate-binding protein